MFEPKRDPGSVTSTSPVHRDLLEVLRQQAPSGRASLRMKMILQGLLSLLGGEWALAAGCRTDVEICLACPLSLEARFLN